MSLTDEYRGYRVFLTLVGRSFPHSKAVYVQVYAKWSHNGDDVKTPPKSPISSYSVDILSSFP